MTRSCVCFRQKGGDHKGRKHAIGLSLNRPQDTATDATHALPVGQSARATALRPSCRTPHPSPPLELSNVNFDSQR